MSPRIGMDVGAVRQAATAVDSAAGELDRLVGRTDGLVSIIAGSWQGPDATAFHEAWAQRHRPAFTGLGIALHSYAKVATTNAAAQDQASAAGAVGGTVSPGPGHGEDGSNPIARQEADNRQALDQAIAAAQASGNTSQLAFLEQLKAQINGSDGHLLYFDPAHDRYAVALGDVSSAQHVAVLVPGVSQDADNDMLKNWIPYSRAIYSASNDAGGSNAVIMWKGYQDPTIPEAPSMTYANDGASALTSFCNGLNLGPHQTLTVIGHSYGSVVTGVALANDGLRPTSVIALGSPGMSVDNVNELNLGPGQFFDEAAPGDPVTGLGYFGTDPSALTFGGTRMSTGSSGAFPDLSIHSSYFNPNSESMQNIADVVTGNYNRVQSVVPTPGDVSSVVVHTFLNPFQDPTDAIARGYTGPGSGVISTVVHIDDSVSNVAGQAAEVATNTAVSVGGDLIEGGTDALGFLGSL